QRPAPRHGSARQPALAPRFEDGRRVLLLPVASFDGLIERVGCCLHDFSPNRRAPRAPRWRNSCSSTRGKRKRGYRTVTSRLSTRIWLQPLTPADTTEYVALRLRLAGCDREVFARDALGLAHEASRGILRDLDRISLLALHA